MILSKTVSLFLAEGAHKNIISDGENQTLGDIEKRLEDVETSKQGSTLRPAVITALEVRFQARRRFT